MRHHTQIGSTGTKLLGKKQNSAIQWHLVTKPLSVIFLCWWQWSSINGPILHCDQAQEMLLSWILKQLCQGLLLISILPGLYDIYAKATKSCLSKKLWKCRNGEDHSCPDGQNLDQILCAKLSHFTTPSSGAMQLVYCLRWKIEFETHCIRKCRQNLFDPVKVQIRVSCISVSVIGVYKKVHWKWDWQCKILWGGKKVKQFNSGRKCVTYLNNFGLGADFFGEIGSLENLSFPNLEIGDCNNCCELAEYFFFNPENTFFWRKMHIVLLI